MTSIKNLVTSGFRRGVFAAAMTARALFTPVAFGVCGFVENDEGQILLVRQRYAAGWRLPGGGVHRFEAPVYALMRELAEEVGLEGAHPPEFFGLYTRRAGIATNLVALYRVRGGRVNFKPGLEVDAILFADPAAPPAGTAPATMRRLAELGGAPHAHYW